MKNKYTVRFSLENFGSATQEVYADSYKEAGEAVKKNFAGRKVLIFPEKQKELSDSEREAHKDGE